MEQSKLKILEKAIYEKTYMVRVPVFSTLSEDEISIRGMYGTGDRKIDAVFVNQFTTCYMNIISLAMISKDGITIKIVNREDMITMLRDIDDYISHWLDIAEYSINITKYPIDTLLILDEFASELYEHCNKMPSYRRKDTIPSIETLDIGNYIIPKRDVSTTRQSYRERLYKLKNKSGLDFSMLNK